jgi:transposase
MLSLSLDLRSRIVAAVEAGEHSLAELADLFSVNISTIVRLLQRFRSTGSIQPKPHGGGARSKLTAKATARLLQLVSQKPDATLAELRAQLGIRCSLTTIFRVLNPDFRMAKIRDISAPRTWVFPWFFMPIVTSFFRFPAFFREFQASPRIDRRPTHARFA